ncbi:MAG: sensor domain-containing protein [Anaerolineaceae bacterium]|nr:sensor domain-containing protein [Anaerolineaceae bacterium]
MFNTVDDYLIQLKSALQGCDQATIQDALADAEDHLRTALSKAREQQPGADEAACLAGIIEDYGSPEEVASAYREIERRLPPALAPSAQSPNRSFWARFFGVVAEPRAWGALLYMLISLLTGILYFTWAVAGISISISLIVLIIGLPFILLFLLSVRGISLVEGRIVEALLGVRMPRRSIFVDKTKGFWARLKSLVASWLVWKTLLYMLLMLPLGIIYFTVFVTLISLGLGLVALPIVQLFIHVPLIMVDSIRYYVPLWGLPFWAVAGALVLLVSMHFAKLIGYIQGNFAKLMLMGE